MSGARSTPPNRGNGTGHPNAVRRLARAGALAHLPSLVAPFLVLALAGVMMSGTGVLVESGLRSRGDGGFLIALASSFAGTATLMTVFVVATTLSLALRQRQRDFSLMRAVGATSAQIRGMAAGEVTLVALTATPLGALVGLFAVGRLAPLLVSAGVVEPGFRLTLSPLPVLGATLFLLVVARLAARIAIRPTLRTPPTTALVQSVVEPVGIGRTRRLTAAFVAVAGLGSAFSPLVVPGAIGSATAAMSAFLLVGAAALAGPVIVERLLGRAAALGGGPATRLALANTRGFSRRLTTVVVPLALALGVGTVQAAVDDTLVAASSQQLTDGLRADLVVTGDGLESDQFDDLLAGPGVEASTALSSLAAHVRTEEEGFGALAWEPTSMLALPTDGTSGILDPQVIDGDLADLARDDTIALSRDARLSTGKGLGDQIDIRWDGATTTRATVVAVYDRGLGFGDHLVGRGTPAAHGVDARPDSVLVRLSGPVDPAVTRSVADLGLQARSTQAYVAEAAEAVSSSQDLSSLLLLLLLVFVGVAAANALVLATAGRRDEVRLLWHTGATRRQLVAMAGVEALVIGAVAWLIGTATVVPAVLGVSGGLLGLAVPAIDLTTYAALSACVLLVPLLTVVPVLARAAWGQGQGQAGAVPALPASA